MKNLPRNTRIFLFGRTFYEVLHKPKPHKFKPITDKVYDAKGKLIRKCFFKYLTDKPDFKIIEELITSYSYYDNSEFKSKILYIVDYKKMTERQTHYDFENDDYYDWKFYFDKDENLLMSKEYQNKTLLGAHLYYDCKGVRLDKYFYIRAKHLDRVLKMDKIELEEFSKPINLMPMSDEDVEITGSDDD